MSKQKAKSSDSSGGDGEYLVCIECGEQVASLFKVYSDGFKDIVECVREREREIGKLLTTFVLTNSATNLWMLYLVEMRKHRRRLRGVRVLGDTDRPVSAERARLQAHSGEQASAGQCAAQVLAHVSALRRLSDVVSREEPAVRVHTLQRPAALLRARVELLLHAHSVLYK